MSADREGLQGGAVHVVAEVLSRSKRAADLVTNSHDESCAAGSRSPSAPRSFRLRSATRRSRGSPSSSPIRRYVEHDGEAEILPGVRVLPTPGHTSGHQSVLVDPDDGLVVIAGDLGHTWKEFDESESGRLLMSLRPRRIWLAHQADPRDLPWVRDTRTSGSSQPPGSHPGEGCSPTQCLKGDHSMAKLPILATTRSPKLPGAGALPRGKLHATVVT